MYGIPKGEKPEKCTPEVGFSHDGLPYISEMPRDETQNLPYIGEIGRQGSMAMRKYGNKVVGWARLTTNGMRQCRKICVRAQKQSFGGRNVRFAG